MIGLSRTWLNDIYTYLWHIRVSAQNQFTLPLHTLFSADSRHITSFAVALDRIPCSQLGSKPLGEFLRPSEPFIKAQTALRRRRLFEWSAQTAIWHCTIGRVACATRGGGMLQDPHFGCLVLCPFLWFLELFLYLKRHIYIYIYIYIYVVSFEKDPSEFLVVFLSCRIRLRKCCE